MAPAGLHDGERPGASRPRSCVPPGSASATTSSRPSPSTPRSWPPTPTRWPRPSTPPTTAAPVPRIDDPDYVPALRALCEQHGVGAVVPLTDLDLEVLAQARARRASCRRSFPTPRSPAPRSTSTRPICCSSGSACPRRRRSCPASRCERFPVMVKPRWGSGARSIHRADDPARRRVLRRLRRGADDGPAADGRARVLDRLPLGPARPRA